LPERHDWLTSWTAVKKAASSIRSARSRHGKNIQDAGPILDFGCGSGRVIRHWRDSCVPVHGPDYNTPHRFVHPPGCHLQNSALTGWSRPLLYADGQFGLIYALSVFTHLTAAQGDAWLAELRRVLRPGGWLLFSTHGEICLPTLTRAEADEFRAGKLMDRFSGAAGSNLCSTFHPPAYLREMTRDWNLIEIVPEVRWAIRIRIS
jgi:SAM-dependent methyltransferase